MHVIIINQTLNTGIFPDTLKVAKVRPLYKKVTIDHFLIIDQYHYFHLSPKSLKRLYINKLTHIFKHIIFIPVNMVLDLDILLN